MVYSMGWNTDQQEALRNYNSLLYLMLQERKDRPFRPLFIGISWPSEWNWTFFEGMGRLLSYWNKANDADEVGMVWISQLLREVLLPVKREEQKNGRTLPIVMVGHSFGARAITSGVFGYPGRSTANHTADDVDLVIGLQGAFSAKRFLPSSGEGEPYLEYKDYARKFVYTWSRHDSANQSAIWSRHMGGKNGHEATLGKPQFGEYLIMVGDRAPKKCDGAFCEHNSCDLAYSSTVLSTDRTAGNTQTEWKASFADPGTISMVDASQLVRYTPYDKGGEAHSDIYTPGMADFIWDVLDGSLAASRQVVAGRNDGAAR
jgi:hypothetical protein